MDFSLTQALLASAPSAFSQATQSAFLSRAAQGHVPKSLLGTWLANDRLYIHAYIRAIGRQLSLLALPVAVPLAPAADAVLGPVAPKATPNERLLKWLIDALVNIHREEAFFVDTARRYGIKINLPTDDAGHVPAAAKLEGLVRFEALFDGLAPPPPPPQQQHTGDHRQATGAGTGKGLPWLEFAVVLWGTERCYLEAWTGAARAQQQQQQQHRSEVASSEAQDLDGGALRREFIPNWTSAEFVEFVDVLGEILDDAVREEMRRSGEGAASEILKRAMVKWRELLDAETTFWPAMP
ncbi:hypothetical protein ESCO_003657 [Escovopsis weberi]|uniref:Thiaminase-2/PQQC domain-containing protein n=1 Tax=Escovopsis weberi TaxID=150374 RepID=A0A0N0RU89_ESCWE|nr:hypothetical protein ESCO_003657 [Escovopsis weberi]